MTLSNVREVPSRLSLISLTFDAVIRWGRGPLADTEAQGCAAFERPARTRRDDVVDREHAHGGYDAPPTATTRPPWRSSEEVTRRVLPLGRRNLHRGWKLEIVVATTEAAATRVFSPGIRRIRGGAHAHPSIPRQRPCAAPSAGACRGTCRRFSGRPRWRILRSRTWSASWARSTAGGPGDRAPGVRRSQEGPR